MGRRERRYVVSDRAAIPPGQGTVQVQGYIFPLGTGTCIQIRRTYAMTESGQYQEAPALLARGLANGASWALHQPVQIAPVTAQVLLLDARWKIVRTLHPLGEVQGTLEVFHWTNDRLMIAEIPQDDPYERPSWCGDDVTADPRYADAALAVHPYNEWAEAG
jgi:hypothetical protein